MKYSGLASTTYRALVVDDEAEVCKLMCLSLKNLGMITVPAINGEQALHLYENDKFDIVISDLQMPKMHGHALISEILKRNPSQLVVIVTGVGDERLIIDLLVRGVQYVIPKPFHTDFFCACVLGVIERNREHAHKEESSLIDSRKNITEQIKQTSTTLSDQLEVIQSQFNQTIQELEKRQKTVEQDYIGSVRMFAELLDHVPLGGTSHVKRVEEIAGRIGFELGYVEDDLRNLLLAALLHDLGKFGLPDYMVNLRPEAISEPDLILWKRHPFFGALVVASVPGLTSAAEIIEEHHENFDGSGFPDHLAGEKTSLSGRILRISDGIDRFMESLPKGDKQNWELTRDHLSKMSGKFYDPKIIAVAVHVIEQMENEKENLHVIELTPEALKAGQKLAEDIYQSFHAKDQVLLRRGVVLTERMVERLRREFQQLAHGGKVRIYEERAFVTPQKNKDSH
jgi:response regulator RpfG family c-di-GMP phosphodiesterase